MTKADLELLVNDALEKGLSPPNGPLRQRHMDCMSSPWRNSPLANVIPEKSSRQGLSGSL